MARPKKNKVKTTKVEKENPVEVVEFINDNGQFISSEGTFPSADKNEFNGSTVGNRIARNTVDAMKEKK